MQKLKQNKILKGLNFIGSLFVLVFLCFNIIFVLKPSISFSADPSISSDPRYIRCMSEVQDASYCDVNYNNGNYESTSPANQGGAPSPSTAQDLPSPKNGGSCGTSNTEVVKQIQRIVAVNDDGLCGPITIKAVQVWQRDHGLQPDGIVGPQTASAMGVNLSSSPAATTPNSPSNNSVSSSDCGDSSLARDPSGLCMPKSQFSTGIAGSKSLSGLLLIIIRLLLTFAGLIAVVMLVIGGFWYITSAGNEEQAEKGRKAIVNAIIGLIVVILAFSIVTIISQTLTTDKFIPGSSSQPQN